MGRRLMAPKDGILSLRISQLISPSHSLSSRWLRQKIEKFIFLIRGTHVRNRDAFYRASLSYIGPL